MGPNTKFPLNAIIRVPVPELVPELEGAAGALPPHETAENRSSARQLRPNADIDRASFTIRVKCRFSDKN